jgi:hypothetical protein
MMLFVLLLLFLEHLDIVQQALAGVGIEIDHTMPNPIGLMKPDAVFSSSMPMRAACRRRSEEGKEGREGGESH